MTFSQQDKKNFLLLHAVIFHYHGLDEDEKRILEEISREMEADDELAWAIEFISLDYFSAFDRAREYLMRAAVDYDKEKKLYYLSRVWEANNIKGYITEMEATALLRLAKDWDLEKELIAIVRS